MTWNSLCLARGASNIFRLKAPDHLAAAPEHCQGANVTGTPVVLVTAGLGHTRNSPADGNAYVDTKIIISSNFF